MADANGALTTDDQALAREWFRLHWKDPVICPVCKSTSWTFGSHVVQMTRFATNAFVQGTTVFPYLPVTCNSCSNTLFFGALPMGITAPPRAPPPPPPLFPPSPAPTQNALSAFMTKKPPYG